MGVFAKKLSEIMKEKEVSQGKLAEVLGVKQQTVSRYIKGDREPEIEIIINIAKYFNVSTDYLLGVEE